jgi:hypothetical protein
MRVSTILERLRDECPGFATVQHGLTSAADGQRPAAYVQPIVVRPSENAYVGPGVPRAHMLETVFAVYILVDRVQDGVSDYGAADEYDDLVAEVRAALVGFTDPDEQESAGGQRHQMEYRGGRLEEYREGIVAWREDFGLQSALYVTPA